ncbi:hypothetical protein VB738_01290 [Cyanobium gracile UHCC 0139]|uniref:Uncharacterized protein n=1 Tax=Cyanobium gracile UHCC 0139 TaxID=3110308 RepID=A0ABU5RQ44_9CYAN|nr:hypothetical protein [Cyanobium gracile]MEA5389883.1 hypothetical protein [Cyanobium gracile UHCC 0139]
MGFFLTQFVKAATSDFARATVIEAVRADPRLDGLIMNDDDDPPRFFVNEIDEVSELDVPEGELGFVLFDDENQSPNSAFSPPPYLVIRKGVAFWVENRRLSDWTATPQAFNEGCFRNACLYDIHGDLWQIVRAELTIQPSFINTILPWRHLPVRIEIRPRARPDIADIVAEVAAILESVNSFTENLNHKPADILRYLRSATQPSELIQYAEKYP